MAKPRNDVLTIVKPCNDVTIKAIPDGTASYSQIVFQVGFTDKKSVSYYS